MVEALVTKGTSMTTSQRSIEAEAILRGAIHLADDLGLISSGLRARNNLSGPLGFRDQAEARRMIREGFEIATRFGHRPFVYQFLYAAAGGRSAYRRMGRQHRRARRDRGERDAVALLPDQPW